MTKTSFFTTATTTPAHRLASSRRSACGWFLAAVVWLAGLVPTTAAAPDDARKGATSSVAIPAERAAVRATHRVTIDLEIGANDFRISDMGAASDPAYDASEPAVAYNGNRHEYLVVWSADDNLGGMINDEFEIFAQRIDAATGAAIGANDFRVSDMGGSGSFSFRASSPAVTYNPDRDEYLVVWSGIDNNLLVVAGGLQIFGQRLDGATGAEIGINDFQISDVGGIGNVKYAAFSPAVVYNSLALEYLVVWNGTDNVGGLSEDGHEIFGQRLGGSTGAQVGANDFRISDAGGTGDPEYNAFEPKVAVSSLTGEYLVVWHADDNVGVLVNNEAEVFGQRLDRLSAAQVGANDFRISDMGGTGDTAYEAYDVDVTFNPIRNEYLVVWKGNDNVGGLDVNQYEIFGQRLDGVTAAEVGANDFRISDMAGEVSHTRVAYSPANDHYLVVWHGDDDAGGLVIDESEIFGQLIDGLTGAEVGANDFPISDMGGRGAAGDIAYSAFSPALAIAAVSGEALVVWVGDDNLSNLVHGELEIFGQLIALPIFDDGFESGDTSAWSNTP